MSTLAQVLDSTSNGGPSLSLQATSSGLEFFKRGRAPASVLEPGTPPPPSAMAALEPSMSKAAAFPPAPPAAPPKAKSPRKAADEALRDAEASRLAEALHGKQRIGSLPRAVVPAQSLPRGSPPQWTSVGLPRRGTWSEARRFQQGDIRLVRRNESQGVI